MNRPYIVVWDPAANFGIGIMPGMILSDHTNTYAAARRRGVVMLPVHPELVRESSAGLVDFRAFGAGALFEQNRLEHGCPLLLLARPAATYVHWAVRIAAPREPMSGTLRIALNADQPLSLRGGITPLVIAPPLADLKMADQHAGHTIGGVSSLSVGEGYVGLCLHAIATGCRVLWVAAALSNDP